MRGRDELQGSSDVAGAAQSALLGREPELAEVLRLVRRPDVRVVTITGPSGVGKTMLSGAVVASLATSEHIGVQRIALDDGTSALEHPGLADALSGTSVLAPLIGPAPEGRRRIVELDGCERTVGLAEAVADAVDDDGGLTVLATSVLPLGVPGEHVVALGPLAVPSPDLDLSAAATFPSVQLVRRSAELARPDRVWGDAESLAAARLARVLDGLPLALELATARCRVMSLVEVANLVERTSPLAALSDRSDADRHGDLRRALEWSYDLLDPTARRMLRRLGVTVGGCSWSLLAALTLEPGEPEGDLLGPLTALVDARFVVVDDEGPDTRYRLPAAVRDLALDLLATGGELAAARDRHADHFLRRVTESAAANHTPAWNRTWLPLQADLPNFIAAIEHLHSTGATVAALDLATELLWLWRLSAQPATAAAVLGDLLAGAPPDLDPERSARASAALAELSAWAALKAPSEHDPLTHLARARTAAADAGSDLALLAVTDAAIPIHLLQLDPGAALVAATDGLAVADRTAADWWRARLLSWAAVAAHQRGAIDDAIAFATESRDVAQAIDDKYQLLRSWFVLLGIPGADLTSLPAVERLLELTTEMQTVLEEGVLRLLLAVVEPDADTAAGHVGVTLDLGRRSGLWVLEELSAAVVVVLAARRGRFSVVAEVSGGLISRWAALAMQIAPAHLQLYEHSVADARRALGEKDVDALQTRGAAEGWQQILDVCEQFLREPASPVAALTAREREVLAELAKGLTNKQIASALGVRPKTVGHHVSNILRKLDVQTRTEAAAVTFAGTPPAG